MNECMDTLINQLYEVMNKNNWSINVASGFMGIGRNTLSNILNRKMNVSLKLLTQIADNLDRSVASLICPEEVQRRKNELLLLQIQADLNELRKGGVA